MVSRVKKWCRWLMVCGVMMGVALHAEDSSQAILRLLNSRSAQTPQAYAKAAEEVASQAKKGRAVYAYVLALIAAQPHPPPAARLDEATRVKYLEKYRDSIKKIAFDGHNALGLYLLSLEEGDTNLLYQAAAAGNVQALNAKGSYLFSLTMANEQASSNEVKQALTDAFHCFRRAAGFGDANGLYNLGSCLWRGMGTARNESGAFDCFRAAAEKGHPEAMNNLGTFFREGIVVKKDLNLAFRWFEKSAKFENPFGQLNCALALRRGEGVKQNYEAAIPYLEKSVASDCVEAIDVLGVALWKGEGVKQDTKRAFSLFIRAAEAGYPPAMENVATCYDKGTGVEADEKKAVKWKIRSRAARGDRYALKWLQENKD